MATSTPGPFTDMCRLGGTVGGASESLFLGERFFCSVLPEWGGGFPVTPPPLSAVAEAADSLAEEESFFFLLCLHHISWQSWFLGSLQYVGGGEGDEGERKGEGGRGRKREGGVGKRGGERSTKRRMNERNDKRSLR